MDIETNFVVTVGFTTKVDHQTTSKILLKKFWARQKKEKLTSQPKRKMQRNSPVQWLHQVWRLRRQGEETYVAVLCQFQHLQADVAGVVVHNDQL